MEHRPVEKRTGGPAVAVDERVVVCEPEVQNYRAYGRVYEAFGLDLIRKSAHGLHPLLELRSWRGPMEDFAEVVAHTPIFFMVTKSACGCRVVKGPFRHPAMKLEDEVFRQRLFAHLADPLHGHVVVKDHPLAPVAWRPSFADHFLGNFASRGGPFQLAGRNRLFNQRPHEVALLRLRVGHGFWYLYRTSCLEVDSV